MLLHTTGKEMKKSPAGTAVGSVEKDVRVRDTAPSWCIMHEFGLESLHPVQLVSRGDAAVQLFD